jgi:DNA-binding LacI/PurR family transcriptional regulator
VHHLRRWIVDGRLSDGDTLPSERTLAGQLGMARGTVRAALDELGREGLISAANEGQRRVQRTGRHGLMANSVALMTDAVAITAPERVPMGMDTFIQLEVLRLLVAAGRHALSIDPTRLAEGGIEQLVAGRPRGVIAMYAVAAGSGLPQLRRLADAGLAVVAHGDAHALRGTDHVTSDQEQGGYDLTRWLLAQGRRRILCFWRFPAQRDWIDDRYAGYVRAMREAKLKPLPALRTPELTIPGCTAAGFADLSRALSGFLHEALSVTGPAAIDAVMTATDGHAYQTAAACRRLGRLPGREILITGYDNLSAACAERAFEPHGLAATVDKDNPAIARTLVELLEARLAGHLPAAGQRRVVPHRLMTAP